MTGGAAVSDWCTAPTPCGCGRPKPPKQGEPAGGWMAWEDIFATRNAGLRFEAILIGGGGKSGEAGVLATDMPLVDLHAAGELTRIVPRDRAWKPVGRRPQAGQGLLFEPALEVK